MYIFFIKSYEHIKFKIIQVNYKETNFFVRIVFFLILETNYKYEEISRHNRQLHSEKYLESNQIATLHFARNLENSLVAKLHFSRYLENRCVAKSRI